MAIPEAVLDDIHNGGFRYRSKTASEMAVSWLLERLREPSLQMLF
jgi:hypothetical protein